MYQDLKENCMEWRCLQMQILGVQLNQLKYFRICYNECWRQISTHSRPDLRALLRDGWTRKWTTGPTKTNIFFIPNTNKDRRIHWHVDLGNHYHQYNRNLERATSRLLQYELMRWGWGTIVCHPFRIMIHRCTHIWLVGPMFFGQV